MSELIPFGYREFGEECRRLKARGNVTFEEAVQLAVRSPNLADIDAFGSGVELFQQHVAKIVYAHLRTPESAEDETAKLIERSVYSADAHAGLRLASAQLIKDGRSLCDCLKKWLCDYLAGNAPPPRRPTRTRAVNASRDLAICMTLHAIREVGFPLTRNDASAPKSASDVVAKALEAHGRAISYDAVVKVWNRHHLR